MSTSTSERKVEQLRRKQVELQKKIAKATGDVATHRSKAADLRAAAAGARSASTAATKMRQADQHERKANDAEKARAKFESEMAKRDAELGRARSELGKAQAMDDQRRQRKDEQRVNALEARLRREEHSMSGRHVEVQAGRSAEWDFFVSHASADKEIVVRPLAEALRSGGARVWYDEFELRVGDDLRARIDEGLARSRLGVVVLSAAFLAGRHWTESELSGLFANQTRILPVWHHVSRDEVASYSPMLAGRVALLTATRSIEAISTELLSVLDDD